MTGSAGTVRYINALTGTSTISGTTNWGLSSFSNWVRVQPGATLRKAGSNQVTLSGSITNNGTLAVSEGKLLIRQPVTGNGNAVMNDGGTLDVGGSFRCMQQAPLIDVQRGGVFDVSAMTSTFRLSSGQTLKTDGNSTVRGNAIAGTGSTVSGRAIFTGSLTVESGAIVRVGGSGLASAAGQVLIDNFDSYSAGKLNAGATGGVWQGVFNGTANVQVVNGNNNQSLEYYGATHGAACKRICSPALDRTTSPSPTAIPPLISFESRDKALRLSTEYLDSPTKVASAQVLHGKSSPSPFRYFRIPAVQHDAFAAAQ